MRQLRVAALWTIVALLGGCGGSTTHNINGIWITQLNDPDGSLSSYSFTTNLMQGSATGVTVTNFGFWSLTPCFASQTAETATFTPNGNSRGIVTGAFAMTITTLFPLAQNNVVSLQGSRDASGSISGTWNLTGQAGCNGLTGRFTMIQPPPV